MTALDMIKPMVVKDDHVRKQFLNMTGVVSCHYDQILEGGIQKTIEILRQEEDYETLAALKKADNDEKLRIYFNKLPKFRETYIMAIGVKMLLEHLKKTGLYQ